MTADPLYFAAYWGPRGETVERCAERLGAFLGGLADVSGLLGSWKPKGRSENEAIAHHTIDEERLAELLLSGAQRRDAGGAPMPELGFRASLWNGVSRAPATLSVTCGATTAAVPNACVVGLPAPEEAAGDLYERAAADAMLGCLVDAWGPDWAVATSNQLRNAVGGPATSPTLGWLTYLSGLGSLPADLDGVTTTPVRSGGSIVAVAEQWSDVDPERAAAARRSLDRLGVLGC